MARSFDPNAWQSSLDDIGGGVNRLFHSMMGIQKRKEETARQTLMDQIAEEERQRRQKREDLELQVKMAELAQKIAATQKRPTEAVETTVQAPAPPSADLSSAMMPETPDTEPTAAASAAEVQRATASMAPTQMTQDVPARKTVMVGNLPIELQYEEDILARQAEADNRKLEFEGRLADARRSMVPAQGRIAQVLGVPEGSMIPEDVAQAAIPRLLAADDPFSRFKPVSGGYLEAPDDGTDPRFVSTAPKGATGLTPQQDIAFRTTIANHSKDPVVQQYDKASGVEMIADKIIANPHDAQKQLAAMYILVKNLDPESAVRAEEQKLQGLTQSYWQQWKLELDRMTGKGAVLSPEVAVAAAKATKDLAKAWAESYRARTARSRAGATVLGFGDQFDEYLTKAQEFAKPGVKPGGEQLPTMNSPAEARLLRPGTRYKTPDGKVMTR